MSLIYATPSGRKFHYEKTHHVLDPHSALYESVCGLYTVSNIYRTIRAKYRDELSEDQICKNCLKAKGTEQ